MKRILAPALLCVAAFAAPQSAAAHAGTATKTASGTCQTSLEHLPAGKRLAFNAQPDCVNKASASTYRSHDTASALAAGCSVQPHPKAAGKVGPEMSVIRCPVGAAPARAAYTH